MVEFKEKIEAEIEQIARSLAKLPTNGLSDLSELELSGVGGIIQSFYNGIENILKQIFRFKKIEIPDGSQWHQQLLKEAQLKGLISQDMVQMLAPYLTFRHLYRNAYVMDLRADKLAPLIGKIEHVFDDFKDQVNNLFQ